MKGSRVTARPSELDTANRLRERIEQIHPARSHLLNPFPESVDSWLTRMSSRLLGVEGQQERAGDLVGNRWASGAMWSVSGDLAQPLACHDVSSR